MELFSCLQFVASAAAALCDGSSDPCTIDLGRASANFATGAASYYAEAVLVNGTDAYYGVNPQFLPTLQVTHSEGGDGFTFLPQMYASVGGSCIQRLFEVAATLQSTGLSFTAEPGYQITLQAVMKGSFSLVGNGYGGLSLPGPLQWVDQNFTATVPLEEGTALSYGTGSASIDSVAFIVSVSSVPEPGPWAMLAAGRALLPWLAKRRSRRFQRARTSHP